MKQSLADLRYFLEIAKTNNLTRASERLGLTQPTLSQAVRRLEEEVQATLLIRDKAGVRLSRAGERLAASSQSFLSDWERLKKEARREEADIAGRVVIGVHPSVAIYGLADQVSKLMNEHKDLEIHFRHGLSRHMQEAVLKRQVDMALVINPLPQPELVIRDILKDEVGFWVGTKGFLTDTLLWDPQLFQGQALLKKTKSHFRRTIESSNLEVIGQLACEGAGVAILPNRVARVHGSQLKKWKLEAPTFEDRLCIVTTPDFLRLAVGKKLQETFRTIL